MKIGVLLINLGTPESSEKKDVAKYLREFLMDPLVIDIPALFRWILVNLLIVPFRAGKSSHAYQTVWTQKGSPLLVHSKNLKEELQQVLGDKYYVELAMRYGRPPIARAFRKFIEAEVSEILVIPLYPQYAQASTLSSIAKLEQIIAFTKWEKPVTILREFYQVPEYINAQASLIGEYSANKSFDHVLFSFHGIPERHVLKVAPECKDCLKKAACAELCNALCYRGQCFATANSLAAQLQIPKENYSVSFQSRLGNDKWIAPYTEPTIVELAKTGKKNLAIACPSFTADCLETLEEIGVRARELFTNSGGEALSLVPCLNSHYDWVQALSQIVKKMETRDESIKQLLEEA